jgi:murein DD-endopeptidase MepM/ murein hydrolase activator NlpD
MVQPILLSLLACLAPNGFDTARALDSGPVVERGDLALRFPLLERDLFYQTTGFDHDPVEYEPASAEAVNCLNYDGRAFPWCYDGHDGSDYLLQGSFETMDSGSATIVAAAGGTVIEVEDGHYDRCHATSGGVDCDGYEMVANKVVIEHSTGQTTSYLHMMSGSVAVLVGDRVKCGDVLGKVGSSGNSSAPHLHFELTDEKGEAFDPYAGEFSQPETWWFDQGGPEEFPTSACAE